MGHQLWVSPTTGYRRKGTRLSEFRALFENGITARAIFEPIQSCPAGAFALEIAEHLRLRDFDLAGVQETERGQVIGFVQRDTLKDGLVRDHLRPFTTEDLVSEAISLADLLSVMTDKQQVFVLTGDRVGGIVARADFNKPPVRVYLFGLISLLEMHLSFWLRHFYEGDTWQTELSAERLRKADTLLQQRRVRNQAVALFDCLQFCDKRELALKKEDLRDSLGLGSKKACRKFLREVEKLRDELAHSQYDISGADWPETISLVEGIEILVRKSDQLVEKKASEQAVNFQSELWASI